MKIHHIGYAVTEIECAAAQFEMLGYRRETSIYEDSIRLVQILFMVNDGYRIELIAPLGENSPVYDLLKKKGAAPYHICYEVDDIDRVVEQFTEDKKLGFKVIKPRQLAPALGDRNVLFCYSLITGLVELLEANV